MNRIIVERSIVSIVHHHQPTHPPTTMSDHPVTRFISPSAWSLVRSPSSVRFPCSDPNSRFARIPDREPVLSLCKGHIGQVGRFRRGEGGSTTLRRCHLVAHVMHARISPLERLSSSRTPLRGPASSSLHPHCFSERKQISTWRSFNSKMVSSHTRHGGTKGKGKEIGVVESVPQ